MHISPGELRQPCQKHSSTKYTFSEQLGKELLGSEQLLGSLLGKTLNNETGALEYSRNSTLNAPDFQESSQTL